MRPSRLGGRRWLYAEVTNAEANRHKGRGKSMQYTPPGQQSPLQERQGSPLWPPCSYRGGGGGVTHAWGACDFVLQIVGCLSGTHASMTDWILNADLRSFLYSSISSGVRVFSSAATWGGGEGKSMECRVSATRSATCRQPPFLGPHWSIRSAPGQRNGQNSETHAPWRWGSQKCRP